MGDINRQADRMAFLASLVISETETVMADEAPHSKRRRALQRLNDAAMQIFTCYDPNLDRAAIYGKASACIDAINVILDADDPGECDNNSK